MLKLNPPYKHLVQKRYLCGPACLQMIILRRNLGWIHQEKIAEELGARILPAVKDTFVRKLKITPEFPIFTRLVAIEAIFM